MGIRIANDSISPRQPPESMALMSLENGVLSECAPLWNMHFRRNMNGKALLPHFSEASDKTRLTEAVEQFMVTGKTQRVPNLSLRRGRSKNFFKASLTIMDAETEEPLEVKMVIHSMSHLVQKPHRNSPDRGEIGSAETRSCPPRSEGSMKSGLSTTLSPREQEAAKSLPGKLETSGRLDFTPAETMQLGLMELMHHLHTEVQCFEWHAVLKLVQLGISKLKHEKCDLTWQPFWDWQCRVCKAMNEFDDFLVECGICGTTAATAYPANLSCLRNKSSAPQSNAPPAVPTLLDL